MSCDYQWELERLQKLKLIIEAYDDAILALSTNISILEYNLDTGQSKQRVTRQDIDKMMDIRGVLFQQYDALCARLGYGGSVQVLPGIRT